MVSIVTTSSQSRSHGNKALLLAIIGVVLTALVFALFWFCDQQQEVPTTGKVNNETSASNTMARVSEYICEETNVASCTHHPVHSTLIIRAGSKGEERIMPLSHTGMIVRAISAGTGIVSTNVTIRREAVFNTRTENFLYRYADSSRHPVMLMPTFGAEAEAEVRKILETDIVVYDTDDKETVAIKESIAELKQELLKAISEGYAAADILNAMREDNNKRVRSRVKMQRELNGLIKSNMVEEAVEYFNRANATLADNFLPPLVFDDAQLPSQP